MASSGQGLDISSFIQAGWERNAYSELFFGIENVHTVYYVG